MSEGLPAVMRRAWAKHALAAGESYQAFVALCGDAPCRVPGMDTVLRLAVRLDNGHDIESAAAREYLYRWNLALRWSGFGVPHTLGM